jgi:hypothetical protein
VQSLYKVGKISEGIIFEKVKKKSFIKIANHPLKMSKVRVLNSNWRFFLS